MQQFTRQQVSEANTKQKSWIIIDSGVYDITRFAMMHPGGELLLLEYAGKDATKEFYSFHRQEVLEKFKRLKIGTVTGEKPKILVETGGDLSRVLQRSCL
jgi:cytochrome b involved in lipid metabolism